MKFSAVIAIAVIAVATSLAMVDATPVLDRRAPSPVFKGAFNYEKFAAEQEKYYAESAKSLSEERLLAKLDTVYKDLGCYERLLAKLDTVYKDLECYERLGNAPPSIVVKARSKRAAYEAELNARAIIAHKITKSLSSTDLEKIAELTTKAAKLKKNLSSADLAFA
jgi:hypothetical protein